MPIYEYHCESCEHSFELLSRVDNMNKPIKKPCPECGKKKVKKSVISKVVTGADATLTLEKMCPGFTKKMETISRSPVINREAKRNILASASMTPTGHLKKH